MVQKFGSVTFYPKNNRLWVFLSWILCIPLIIIIWSTFDLWNTLNAVLVLFSLVIICIFLVPALMASKASFIINSDSLEIEIIKEAVFAEPIQEGKMSFNDIKTIQHKKVLKGLRTYRTIIIYLNNGHEMKFSGNAVLNKTNEIDWFAEKLIDTMRLSGASFTLLRMKNNPPELVNPKP